MMDPAKIPQEADPITSAACVDTKRLRCSATPNSPVFKVIIDDDASSWLAQVPPLDDENLLLEILLRLPPKPSSLPRASLVCKRWRNILSDPQFLGRYWRHHRKPPLLGFITGGDLGMKHDFVPVLGTKPDRIPAERFAVPKSSSPYQHWHFLGCRHGLAILLNECQREVVVWDPLTGQQHRVPFPAGLRNTKRETFWVWHAAVLCTNDEDGHVHGDCFLSPFKLVLTCGGHTQAFACLYESLSGVWGNIASTSTTDAILLLRPSILIGNAVYWLLCGGDVLVFDTERQSLAMIKKPTDAIGTRCWSFQPLRTDDSGLGFAVLSKLSIQLWKRKLNSDGVGEWVLLQKTIQLEGLFPRGMRSDLKEVEMVGYDEDSNVIVLATYIGDFMLELESMRSIRISRRKCCDNNIFYAYRNFYTAGRVVGWKWLNLKL